MKYLVKLNGKEFEVEVEAKDGTVKTAAPAAAEAPTVKEEPAVAPAAAKAVVTGAGEKMTSPMPGTILQVNTSVGAAVKAGDVLFILEAMKMENEIMAPSAGRIAAISTTKGSSVNSGELLVVIE